MAEDSADHTGEEMPRIRVLVVDDSAFMQKALANVLSAEPLIEIVGFAGDGYEAIELREELNPDVITMDVMMPRLNGIEAVRHLMNYAPVPIVMVSSYTNQGAKYTVESLSLGAIDCVLKPDSSISLDIHLIQEELIKKVLQASRIKTIRSAPIGGNVGKSKAKTTETPDAAKSRINAKESEAGKFNELEAKPKFIAIGSSTGGPAILRHLLTTLPHDYPIPIAIVQHITPSFFNELVNIFNRVSNLKVKRVENRERPQKGTVYLASPRAHSILDDSRYFRLSSGDVVDGHIPSASVLIKAVADTYNRFGMGVILSGMGSDGASGMRALADRGGATYVLDEASSVVYGMPQAVIDAEVNPEIISSRDLPLLLTKIAY